MTRCLIMLLWMWLLLACLTVAGTNKKKKQKNRVQRHGRARAAPRRIHANRADQEWYRASGLGALDGHGLSTAALQCTIDRFPAATMTAEIFQRQYDLQRPVILTGAVDAWNVPTDSFRRSALLELADRTDATVMVGGSSSIPMHHGEGHRRVKLKDFLESTMGEEHTANRPGRQRDPAAVFDRGEFFQAHPELREQLVWPATVYPLNRSGGAEQTYFSVGGASTGVQFHYHADGWSMQYFGRKAWWFFPPGVTPLPTYPPQVSIRYWVEHMLPVLLRDDENRPIHCVIDEGDWLYVPEGWYHATFALEDSVSIASQLGGVGPSSRGQQAVTAVQRLWGELWLLSSRNQVADAIEKSNEIFEMAPNNREVVYQRALLLSRLAVAAGSSASATGQDIARSNALLSEATAGFKAAIDANPRQAEPYNNYAAMVMAGWQQQQQQQHGGAAMLKLKGLKSARAALQQATKLNPTNANAWENLALLHEYDSQRKMTQHAQLATSKGNKGKKNGARYSSSELERQVRELARAAAEARRNAREAEAVLEGFSDPNPSRSVGAMTRQ